MINILIPLAGDSKFFDRKEYQYPEPLIEVDGKPIIETVIENYQMIKEDFKFLFILKSEDCNKAHLDNSVKLLTGDMCDIVKTKNKTMGAAASALLAIEYLDNDYELIIANGNQFIEVDFNLVLKDFRDRELDAGVICFESIHPKWSYAKIDMNSNLLIESSEKNPISKNAIAGFYYFKKGGDFVKSAILSIKRDAKVDGAYFIAPTLNEFILKNKKVGAYKIDSKDYHSFYSPQKIEEYKKKR
jgi:dTDP-glucose pyrophosphorylase